MGTASSRENCVRKHDTEIQLPTGYRACIACKTASTFIITSNYNGRNKPPSIRSQILTYHMTISSIYLVVLTDRIGDL